MKKIIAGALLSSPMLAMAHPGHESISVTQGVLAGALHPLMGLDHLLAFAALGVLLFRLTSKQAGLIGSGFIALLALGFYGAQSGVLSFASNTVESLIMLSVVLSLGVVMASRFIGHHKSALLLTAFAVFHGMAHGVEVPATASAHGFAAGFLVSSAMLMLVVRTLTLGIAAKVVNKTHAL
ncbi:MAG: HupE/UreJ family protein [Bermanella sp.]